MSRRTLIAGTPYTFCSYIHHDRDASNTRVARGKLVYAYAVVEINDKITLRDSNEVLWKHLDDVYERGV